MEGAVLSGKLAAEVLVDKAANRQRQSPEREIQESIVQRDLKERKPTGVRGNYPIAFGGGQQGSGSNVSHP